MDTNMAKAVLGVGAVAASLLGLYVLSNKIQEENKNEEAPKTTTPKTVTTTAAPENQKEIQVSIPFNCSKDFSITLDPVTGHYQGIPNEVKKALQEQGFTEEQIVKNPSVAIAVLYSLDYEKIRRGSISPPLSFQHNIHLYVDPKTNKIEGIPPVIREAIKKTGKTEEDIIKNPEIIKDLLYNFSTDEVFEKPQISTPVSVTHDFSIKIDPRTGSVTGIPKEIEDAIKLAGYTVDQVLKNPVLVKDLLYNFDYANMKPDAPQISSPSNFTHDFSLTVDPTTGEIKGVPQEILDAIKNAGYTTKEIIEKPEVLKAILYNFDCASLSPNAPKISTPSQITHDFQISYDPKTGQFTGIPEAVLNSIKEAGYTVEQVVKDPLLVKDLLYGLDYEKLKQNVPLPLKKEEQDPQ